MPYDGAVAPRTSKPRIVPALRPDLFLILQHPPRRDRHPALVYLDGFSLPNSRRAMERALGRIAELVSLSITDLKWWGIPNDHHWAIQEELRKRYAPATANQSLSALRGVVGMAHEMGLIPLERYQAALAIPLVPVSSRTGARTPSRAQIDRLIRTAEGDPKGARDAALLGVLAGAGLKRSEVAALRLADFRSRTGTLRLRAGTIKLGTEERALLRAWIAYRGRANGPLFLPMRKSGRPERRQMSGQAVAAVVADRGAQAGLGRLSPEDLRRAYLASTR
jgi:integrase